MARRERLPQPIDFGKYQLIERIAMGRMGEVFKAKRGGVEGFEKVLVVKRLAPRFSSSQVFVDTFVDEAKLTVSLSHANIVQVMDLGQQDGSYFIAMEHVAGYDLGAVRQVLKGIGDPFPLDIAVFAVSEVAKGLDYAHRRKDYNFESLNIVHRDLSPANILISFEGEVKITDFGISRALEVVGADDNIRRKFLYASPEQARGEVLSHHSDIFSLGLVLYELVSGVHPYDDPDPRVIQRRAMEANVRPIRQMVDLPRALEQIINSSLAPDPAMRVDSAGTLYEELISYLFASGHKADNRSLSLFMQEVKTHEADVFQAMSADANAAQGSLAEAEVIDLDDILDLDAEQLSEVSGGGDLFALGGGAGGAPPAERGGLRVGHSAFVGAEGMRTSAATPSARLEASQQTSRFDSVAQPDSMPQRLGQLADGLQMKRGAAVMLTGELGAGRDYLPDRLPARLRARGLFQVLHLTLVEDDRDVPFALATALMRFSCGMPPSGRLHAQAYKEDALSEERAIMRLSNQGLSVEEVEVVRNLCGLVETYQKGFHAKREWIHGLVARLARTLAGQSPVVVMIDGVEHLDPLSVELLVGLSEMSAQVPLLLIGAGGEVGVGRFESLQRSDGSPCFEWLSCQERSVAEVGPEVLEGLSGPTLAQLTALALLEQPLPLSFMPRVLGGSADEHSVSCEELASRGVLRLVPPEHVMLPSGPVRDALRARSVGDPATSAYARRLLEATYGGVDSWLSARIPRRLRLMLDMGSFSAALDGAMRYGARLRVDGWREAALDHYEHFEVALRSRGYDEPRGLSRLWVARAEVAIELMQRDAAQAAINTLVALVEASGDVVVLAQAHRLEAALASMDGEANVARGLLRSALSRARELGDVRLSVSSAADLGHWHLECGDLREAQRHLFSALSLGRETGLWERGGFGAAEAARAAALYIVALCRRGETHQARAEFERLEQEVLSSALAMARCHLGVARVALLRAAGSHVEGADEAERVYNMAREHNFVHLALELALEVTRASIAGGDHERGGAYARHLVELGQLYGHQVVASLGADMSDLVLVLTSTGDQSLDALQRLHDILKRAQEAGDDPRAHMHAHHLLYTALSHLGSGRDAEHHRVEAQRYASGLGIAPS